MTLPEVGKEAFEAIEQTIAKLLYHGCRVITLGGDHSITYPIIRAHTNFHDRLDILHFDAHHSWNQRADCGSRYR